MSFLDDGDIIVLGGREGFQARFNGRDITLHPVVFDSSSPSRPKNPSTAPSQAVNPSSVSRPRKVTSPEFVTVMTPRGGATPVSIRNNSGKQILGREGAGHANIGIPDPRASSRHLEIERIGEEWRIKDTSRNGTTVYGPDGQYVSYLGKGGPNARFVQQGEMFFSGNQGFQVDIRSDRLILRPVEATNIPDIPSAVPSQPKSSTPSDPRLLDRVSRQESAQLISNRRNIGPDQINNFAHGADAVVYTVDGYPNLLIRTSRGVNDVEIAQALQNARFMTNLDFENLDRIGGPISETSGWPPIEIIPKIPATPPTEVVKLHGKSEWRTVRRDLGISAFEQNLPARRDIPPGRLEGAFASRAQQSSRPEEWRQQYHNISVEYPKHISRIASFPQSEIDAFVGQVAELWNRGYNIDLQHSNNILIDFDNQRLYAIDAGPHSVRDHRHRVIPNYEIMDLLNAVLGKNTGSSAQQLLRFIDNPSVERDINILAHKVAAAANKAGANITAQEILSEYGF